ncbi:ArdC-like ssDNA-binding domain-containing protein [Nocardia abscessus]|uniref:ArdC-like ssDNA-binding domain-containing protein n=1 Tax=Nocardia abscessus TaxID=120957 RepID=UPI0024583729|nr:ArdC-like ssDNA-binding domain-containing protein [Nocardia abscessus]
MARRKKYSEEERAARQAADEQIREGGNELLSDPEAVAVMVAQLARLTCPKLLRYSLRNVALLFNQAADRDMTITDVDSFKGWAARGRHVCKGEKALRIVAPKGSEEGEAAEGEASEQPAEPAAEADAEGGNFRVRFRMVPVFDIAQTEGIEDFEGEPVEVAPVAEPAAAVCARLLEQFDAIGYTVTEGEAPAIDDDAHTVTVSDGRPLEELAQALAALLTRPADERPRQVRPATSASTPAAAQAAPGIPLDLGEFGTGRAVVEVDHDGARVYYQVTAPSVRGTFTVEFYEAAESGIEPRRVCVKYGRADKPGNAYGAFGQDRPDRPKVNGIRLASHSTVTLSEVETLRWLYVSRLVQGRYDLTTDRVPDRTGDRVRAVVRAILLHFQTLPEFGTLFKRAAALEAPVLQRIQADRARELSRRIAGAEAEREEAEHRARYFAGLAAGEEIAGAQLEMFAS